MKHAMLILLLCGCPAKKPPEEPKPVDPYTEPVATPGDAGTPTTPKVDPWCANRPEKAGPFVLDATLAAQRRGATAKTYADVDSTKEQPIEVCGLEGARLWLEKTRCPDGKTAGEQQGRVGSVGMGGRCNTMIEKFKVGCPDGAINILFDVHMCGPGESM